MAAAVNYEYVKNLQKEGPEILIDVREPKELQESGIIPNSINIPSGTLEETMKNLPSDQFKSKYGKVKPDKDTLVIVSCRSGTRSAKAQALLQELGYKNVKNYAGGWLDWEKHLK